MFPPHYYLGPSAPGELEVLQDWVRSEGVHLFSVPCRRELALLIGDPRAVQLIEADCTIADYRNAAEHKGSRERILKLHRERGFKLPPGKKSRPEMKKMVASAVGIMVAFGMPPGTGENSKMVLALRAIASELEMAGDARDELRRIAKLTASLQARDRAKNEVFSTALEDSANAFRELLDKLDGISPPSSSPDRHS